MAMAGAATKQPRPRRTKGRSPSAREKRKAEYIEALAEHHEYEAAGRAVGIDRRTVFTWRQEDPEFQRSCDDARGLAKQQLMASIFTRAMGRNPVTGRPVSEHVAALLAMFLAKGWYPEYKDAYRPEVATHEIKFTWAIPLPAGVQERLAALPEHVIEGEVVSEA
jgi:hypothetical protein